MEFEKSRNQAIILTMDPEQRRLLEDIAKLSQENHKILLKMRRAAKWAMVWGFIKILLVIVPLVLGYIYLGPQIDQTLESIQSARSLFIQ